MLVAAVAVMLIGSDTTLADSRAGIDTLLRSDALVPERSDGLVPEADWARAETDDLKRVYDELRQPHPAGNVDSRRYSPD